MRRSSLLEMNQRLRRTSDRTLLFITSFLKRRSNCSGDSPGLLLTVGNLTTSLFGGLFSSNLSKGKQANNDRLTGCWAKKAVPKLKFVSFPGTAKDVLKETQKMRITFPAPMSLPLFDA